MAFSSVIGVVVICVGQSAPAAPPPADEIKSLIADTKSEDLFKARRAAQVLGQLGADASSAAPALLEALKADDVSLRREAAGALGAISPPESVMPQLREALEDEDVLVRVAAAAALWKIERSPTTIVPFLVGIVKDKRSPGRAAAAAVIGDIGKPAQDALPALRGAAQEKEFHGLRVAAARSLWQVSGMTGEVVDVLIDVIRKSQDPKTRSAAATALGEIGPAAKSSVPAIVEMIASATTPQQPTPAVPTVASADEDATGPQKLSPSQLLALETGVAAIRQIEGSELSVPTLLGLSRLNHPAIGFYVVGQLADMGPAIAGPLFVVVTGDETPARVFAGAALQRMVLGATLPEAVVDNLKHDDLAVRSLAIRMLARSRHQDARQYLKDALTDRERPLRLDAAEAIWQIDGTSSDVLPTLLEIMRDADSPVRSRAARLLGEMGPDAKPAIDALIAALGDRRIHVRLATACALGKMGTAAKTAQPALRQVFEDDIPVVRLEARQALIKLGVEEDSLPEITNDAASDAP